MAWNILPGPPGQSPLPLLSLGLSEDYSALRKGRIQSQEASPPLNEAFHKPALRNPAKIM